jgi:phosphotransferase system enzyme I (PtsP)
MLDFLRRIVQEVSSAESLDTALRILVGRVCEALSVTVCSVYLVDKSIPKQDELVLLATKGLREEAVGHIRMRFDEGLTGLVAQRAEPINLDDAAQHPRFKFFTEAGEEELKSFLGVPIINYGKLLGVLVVQQREQRRFNDDHVAFLITLAAQLAGAITQAGASEDVSKLMRGERPSRDYIEGLPGSSGVAMGTAVVVYSPADLDAVPDRPVVDLDDEMKSFHQAVYAVVDDMTTLNRSMQNVLPAEERALFDAFAMMLEGGSLIDDTEQRIKDGNWAPGAFRDTIKEHARIFEEMDDMYLRDRADDIRDLGRRVIAKLLFTEDGLPARAYPEQTILIGEEISATQLAAVPADKLKGVVSVRGSGSSHVAILARAMQIPAVMGTSDLPVGRIDEQEVFIDGYGGRVYVHPHEALRAELSRLIDEEQQMTHELLELIDLPAQTQDGFNISLFANTGLQSDINPAISKQADGIGLFRTEVPFQIRTQFPGEEEQEKIYREALEAFAPRPVVIRTLDVGGDKMLSYLPVYEENPFLGWRGIRISLDHPDIFITQIRAMLKANRGLGNLQILLPMVSGMSELRAAMTLIQRAHSELLEEGCEVNLPPIGLMIEVPAAVYLIGPFARHVDFLSIGSNDLTQYLLAVDRNNERVGKLYDTFQPSVLSAILAVIQGAHIHNKPVSICGELAGNPMGALILLGMGMESLSMSAGSILAVKKVIRAFTREKAIDIMSRALTMEDGSQVRDMLAQEMEAAGLGGLIRAGR